MTQECTSAMHHAEYDYWRLNGRNVSATARKFKRTRLTISRWRDAEQWELLAAETEAALAAEIAATQAASLTQHVQDGTAAVETARRNHQIFQQSVLKLATACQAVILAASKLQPTAMLEAVAGSRIDLLAQLTATDARITALLYPALIPQHVAVAQVTAPADEMREQLAASLVEFEQLTAGEPRGEA